MTDREDDNRNTTDEEPTLKEILEKVSDAVDTDEKWIEFVMAWQCKDPIVESNKEDCKQLLQFLMESHKEENPQADYSNKKVVAVFRRYNLSVWAKCLRNGIKSLQDLTNTEEDTLEQILNSSG